MAIKQIKWTKDDLVSWEIHRSQVEGVGQDWTRIGASDVSVVTGSNKWKCKQRLFYHLCNYYSHFQMTDRTVAGHLIEPIIKTRWEAWETDHDQFLRNALVEYKNRRIRKAKFFLINDKYPNIFASMDYVPIGASYSPFTGELYHKLTPIEMKHTTKDYYKLWTPEGVNDGKITQSYKEQVHTQMMAGNTEVSVFLTLVDGVTFVPTEIERDRILCEKIDHDTRHFAEIVSVGKSLVDIIRDAESEQEREQAQTMFDSVTPEPIGMDDNKDLIASIYRTNNGLEMMGDDSDEMAMKRYVRLGKIQDMADTHKLEIRNKLTFKMKDFEYLKSETMKMTNRKATAKKRAHFSIKPIKK